MQNKQAQIDANHRFVQQKKQALDQAKKASNKTVTRQKEK